MKLCVILILALSSYALGGVPENPDIIYRGSTILEPMDVLCESETVRLVWQGTQSGVGQGDVNLYLITATENRDIDRTHLAELTPGDLQSMRYSWEVYHNNNGTPDSVFYYLELAAFEGTGDVTYIRSHPFHISYYRPEVDISEKAVFACSGSPLTLEKPEGKGLFYKEEWTLPPGSTGRVADGNVFISRPDAIDAGEYVFKVFDECGRPLDTVTYTLQVVQWPPAYFVFGNLQGSNYVLCEEDILEIQDLDNRLYSVEWKLLSDNRVVSNSMKIQADALPEEGILSVKITSEHCPQKEEVFSVPFVTNPFPQLGSLTHTFRNCNPVLEVEVDEDVVELQAQHFQNQEWMRLPQSAVHVFDISKALAANNPMRLMLIGVCDTNIIEFEPNAEPLVQMIEPESRDPLSIGREDVVDIPLQFNAQWLNCISSVALELEWDPRNAMLLPDEKYTVLAREYQDTVERATLELPVSEITPSGELRSHLRVVSLFGVSDELEISIRVAIATIEEETVTTTSAIQVPIDVWRDANGDPILRNTGVEFVQASPNPASRQDQVVLQSSKLSEGIQELLVLNSQGQKVGVATVAQSSSLYVRFMQHIPGVYHIIAKTPIGVVASKVVVH